VRHKPTRGIGGRQHCAVGIERHRWPAGSVIWPCHQPKCHKLQVKPHSLKFHLHRHQLKSSMDRLHVVVQRSYNKRSTRYFVRFIFYINENYILPKYCTLIVLRYIEEEKDESDPEEWTSASSRRSKKRTSGSQRRTSERNLHNFLLTKAMKVHEQLLESLTSLLSNESSGDRCGHPILPLDQNCTDYSEGQQSVVTEWWYNLPSKTVPIYNVLWCMAYISGKLLESSFTPKKRFIIWTSQ